MRFRMRCVLCVQRSVQFYSIQEKEFFLLDQTIIDPLVANDVAVASASFEMFSKYKPESELVSVMSFIFYSINCHVLHEFESKSNKIIAWY